MIVSMCSTENGMCFIYVQYVGDETIDVPVKGINEKNTGEKHKQFRLANEINEKSPICVFASLPS